MKNNNKIIAGQLLDAYPIEPIEPHNMQNTILKAKQLLVDNNKYNYAKGFFIRTQIKNISPFFWLIQFICFTYAVLNVAELNDMESIRTLFAVLVPILVLYMLPELYKTHVNNMTELEAACTHSPAKIVAAKLMMISISNFIIVVTISFILGVYHQLNIFAVLAQGLIPLNIAISISLLFFGFVKIKSPYAMFVSTILIATALVSVQMQNEVSVIFNYWEAALLLSFLILLTLIVATLYRIKNVKEWYYGA